MSNTTKEPEPSAPLPSPARPRLLDQVRNAIRRKHYSLRTEDAYVHWIKRFIYFHGRRHPRDLGEVEVTAFLNHLARDRGVAAATQNQALSAVLFLYKEVLRTPLAWYLYARDEQGRPGRPQSYRRPARPGGAAARGLRGLRAAGAQAPRTRTSFIRPEAPLLIVTADLAQPKCAAIRPMSSLLALPSTGGDLSLAIQVPSSACTSELAPEFGFTLTCSVVSFSGKSIGRLVAQ